MEEVFVVETENAIVRFHGKPNMERIKEASKDYFKAILKEDAKKAQVKK